MVDSIGETIALLVAVGLALCIVALTACGMYALGSVAWNLWARDLVSRPRRHEATFTRLVDGEAEGWFDEIDWSLPSWDRRAQTSREIAACLPRR